MARREHVIEVTRSSAASPTQVFALLRDARSWPSWSPLGSASIEAPAAELGGVGEVRVFRTGRFTSRERVVACDPPSHFAYALLSGLPLDGYEAHVRVAPSADGGSLITWRSAFRARIPGTGWIFQRKLGAFIAELVDGLTVAAASSAPAGTAS